MPITIAKQRSPGGFNDLASLPIYQPNQDPQWAPLRNGKEKREMTTMIEPERKKKKRARKLEKILKSETPRSRESFARDVELVAVVKYGGSPEQATARFWREHPEYEQIYESLPKATHVDHPVQKSDSPEVQRRIESRMLDLMKRDHLTVEQAMERALGEQSSSVQKVFSRQTTTGKFRRKEDADTLPLGRSRGTSALGDRLDDHDAAYYPPGEEDGDDRDELDEDELPEADEAADQDADEGMRRQIKRKRGKCDKGVSKAAPRAVGRCFRCYNEVSSADVVKRHACPSCGQRL